MKNDKAKMLAAIIGCLVLQLCVGIIYLWSVLKSPAIEYYGWESGKVNLVASIMLFSFCFGNLIGGTIQDKIGPKIVSFIGCAMFGCGILLSSFIPPTGGIVLFYLSYCVLAGLGSGFAYGSAISCLQKWLPHRRGLASGLAVSSFGLSTVVFSPLSSALIKSTGSLPATLRILSIVFLIVGLIACVFISVPSEAYIKSLNLPASKTGSGNDKTLGQAIKTVPFWCLFLAIFFFNGTWNMLTPLIKDLGVDRGLSDSMAVMTVSLTGITNALGRLLMSTASDKFGRSNTEILLSLLTIVCAVCLIFAPSYFYMIIVLVTAFCYGGPSAINPAFSTDFFGSKYSGTNYGVIMLALGLSSVFFNSISNALYKATGAYTLTFIMGAVTALITIILMKVIENYRKKLAA